MGILLMVRFYSNDIAKRCGGDSSKTFDIKIPDMTLSVHLRRSFNPDRYIFSPSLMTEIMYDAFELIAVAGILRNRFKKHEIKVRNQAKSFLHSHWLQADFIPNLSFAEKKEKERLFHSKEQALCMIGNNVKKTEYVWDLHGTCKNLFIISKDSKVVLRKRLRSKNMPDNQNFLYFLSNDEKHYNEFYDFLRYVDAFLGTKQPRTQKNWEKFFEEKYLEERLQGAYTRTVPIINSLSEKIRKMLVFELLGKHWQEIAPTKIEAQHVLQKDHKKIYELAKEKGLIEDATPLISIESERNMVNHYDPSSCEVRGYRYLEKISGFFWNFVREHTPLESFILYDKKPLKITTKRMNELENQYHAIRSDSMVMKYARHTHPEIDPKNTKLLLGSVEGDKIFMHESSPVANHVNMRCPAAHGQKTKAVCNISEQTVQKMIKEINLDTPLRQAGIQFVHTKV